MITRVLVVDDDPVQRRLLDAMLRKFDYEPVLAEGGQEALELLSGPEGAGIGCAVLDLVMPELDGFTFLQRLRERGINLPVIVQTAQGSIDTVVTAMRAGAVDFVVKPVGAERMQVSLQNALSQAALAGEVRRIQRTVAGALAITDLSSASPRMQQTLKLAEKAAASDIPVLMEGESGVNTAGSLLRRTASR
jgi:DNA-binding NtrC family response regulator